MRPVRPYRARRGRARDEGAAMVELALVLPVLMLLVIGAIRFGVAFNAQIEMSGAAREGARYVVAHQSDAAVASNARTAAKAASVGLNLADAEIAIVSSSGGSACPLTGGADVRVTITRTYSLQVPFLPTPSVVLRGIGDMQC